MKDEHASSLEAIYAQALQHEKAALHVLQAHESGTDGNARAWQVWSEAITRTNEAWRELSIRTLGKHAHRVPFRGRSSDRGVDAPSR